MTQQLNPESQELMIELKDMNKWYGEFHVLKNINLEVKKGEKIVICGPSGSGKSTMIRCINRLEEHQAGSIYVSGTELTEDLKNIEAVRRESLVTRLPNGQPSYGRTSPLRSLSSLLASTPLDFRPFL